MALVTVAPAPGCAVRDQDTLMLVPEEGIEVDDQDLYWVRRLADGDVVILTGGATLGGGSSGTTVTPSDDRLGKSNRHPTSAKGE